MTDSALRKSMKREADRTTAPDPLLLSVNGAAATLGISRPTLYKLLAAGKVGAVKLGGRTLIRMTSLRDYVGTLESYPVTVDAVEHP